MANQEWLYRTASPIFTASAAANLQGEEKQMASGLAWLAAKHKELNALQIEDAKEKYANLDKNAQESLKSIFGDAEYLQDEQSWMGKAFEFASKPVEWAWDGLGSYFETISNVYRTGTRSGSVDEFFKNWDENFEGDKVFDAEREKIVDARYDYNVSNIAKKFARGMGFGEILSSLSTDEEFKALQRFANGDKESYMAIRDYEDAKISWGRDIARLFNLNPDVGVEDQGVEGTAYKYVSGFFDLAGDIAFDPLTYIALPIKAIQGARFGVVSLMKAELLEGGFAAGKMTFGERSVASFQKVTGSKKTGWDRAFESKSVRTAFDKIGAEVSAFSKANPQQQARIVQNVQEVFPHLDRSHVIEFGKAGITDADSALKFLKTTDLATKMVQGLVGSKQAMLPRHTVTTNAKNAIRNAVKGVTGYGPAATLTTNVTDDALEELAQNGQSVSAALRVKEIRSFNDRWIRMTERALVDRRVNIGGTDALSRKLQINSSSTMYSVARVVLPRYEARLLANMYAVAPNEAAARNIIRGTYDTIAEHLGIQQGTKEWDAYERIMHKWSNPQYSEKIIVDPEMASILNVPAGSRINPAELGGTQYATAAHHLTSSVILPDLGEIAKISQKRTVARAISTTVNNEFMQSLTDFWSAANLLPRLGIRSVLDESLFQGLTLPIALLPQVIKGYRRTITERVITKPEQFTKITPKTPLQEKEIGMFARVMRSFFVNMDEATAKKALASQKGAREVLEQQLAASKVNNFIKFGDDELRYVGDDYLHGHSSEIRGFTDGATRAMSDGSPIAGPSMATTEMNLNVAPAMKELGVKFANDPALLGRGTNEYKVNFLIQLNNRVDRNGKVGKLAVQNMDNPAEAIAKIAEYLKSAKGQVYHQRFDRYSQIESGARTVEQDATDMFMHVRSLFISEKGELNTALLDKVRGGKNLKDITAVNFTLDDFNQVADLLPSELMGFSLRAKTYRQLPDFINDIIDRGFQVADRQISTLSREPVYTAYMIDYRKQFAGAEKQLVDQMVVKGMKRNVAEAIASKRFARLSADMSMNRMIGFIDNPNVRSVAALNSRNVARYYRAQEDFFRRVGRVASPEALVRLRLATQGLEHSGFIHEDENGDKYFSIPADEVLYPIYSEVINLLGDKPRQMMPLELTGKIKMLTPSADPESWAPTFSSPFSSVSISLVSTILNNFGYPELSDQLTRGTLGPYAENRDYIDMVTPTAVKRAFEALNATGDSNAQSEQITSAFFKSAAYYSANGMGVDSTSTIAEREQFIRDMTATARNVVAVRNLLGIFSPVAPGLSELKDVPDYLLELDTTSWRSEFRSLVEKEFDKGNPDAYDTALMKWTKMFPGRLVYTVPETEMETVASVKKTKQTVSWIKENQKLVAKHRQGSTFLMPQMNKYDLDAYAYLKREGYTKSKDMDQYIEDIANVRAENEYFDLRASYEKQVSAAATPEQARAISRDAEIALSAFKDVRPYLKLALEHNSTGNQLKIDVLTDTRNMLSSNIAPDTATANLLRTMISEYDNLKIVLDSVTAQSDAAGTYKRMLRSEAAQRISEIAGINPNAQAFYETILKRLIEG